MQVEFNGNEILTKDKTKADLLAEILDGICYFDIENGKYVIVSKDKLKEVMKNLYQENRFFDINEILEKIENRKKSESEKKQKHSISTRLKWKKYLEIVSDAFKKNIPVSDALKLKVLKKLYEKVDQLSVFKIDIKKIKMLIQDEVSSIPKKSMPKFYKKCIYESIKEKMKLSEVLYEYNVEKCFKPLIEHQIKKKLNNKYDENQINEIISLIETSIFSFEDLLSEIDFKIKNVGNEKEVYFENLMEINYEDSIEIYDKDKENSFQACIYLYPSENPKNDINIKINYESIFYLNENQEIFEKKEFEKIKSEISSLENFVSKESEFFDNQYFFVYENEIKLTEIDKIEEKVYDDLKKKFNVDNLNLEELKLKLEENIEENNLEEIKNINEKIEILEAINLLSKKIKEIINDFGSVVVTFNIPSKIKNYYEIFEDEIFEELKISNTFEIILETK